jgi:hypothetical protein
MGTVGQDNFFANAAGATFDIAFVQHEPGSQCTTPMDKPFMQNLQECERYLQRSYPYNVANGTVNSQGALLCYAPASTVNIYFPVTFRQRMAKVPTMSSFSPTTGGAGNIRDITAVGDRTVNSFAQIGETGFSGWILATAPVALAGLTGHYVADTGW